MASPSPHCPNPLAPPVSPAPSSPIPDTSTGLLRNLEKGSDAERWPEFERAYDPVVRRFLAIVSKIHPLINPKDCDDIVQETMLALWRLFPRRSYDRSQGRFRDFLFGVVCRVATKATSRELQRRRREEEAVAGAMDLAADNRADEKLRAEAEELWKLVVDRIFAKGRWSDKAKAVFVRTERGEPMEDVARAYGMSVNAVHQLRHRAAIRVEAELRALASPGGELAAALLAAQP